MISVILPLYNKASDISTYLDALDAAFASLDEPYEVICVDDGSTDQSFETVRERGSDRVKLLQYGRNEGKGFALWFGFYQSRGDIIVFTDADLDLHPRQIPAFVESIRRGEADVVIGSKRHPESRVQYPRLRRLLSASYQLLIRSLFGLNIRDTQVGLKAFRRPILEDVLPRVTVKRFAFDLELLVVCHRRGYRIVERPVDLTFQFTSTVPLSAAIIRMVWDTFAIAYRRWILRYYDRPHGGGGRYQLE